MVWSIYLLLYFVLIVVRVSPDGRPRQRRRGPSPKTISTDYSTYSCAAGQPRAAAPRRPPRKTDFLAFPPGPTAHSHSTGAQWTPDIACVPVETWQTSSKGSPPVGRRGGERYCGGGQRSARPATAPRSDVMVPCHPGIGPGTRSEKYLVLYGRERSYYIQIK